MVFHYYRGSRPVWLQRSIDTESGDGLTRLCENESLDGARRRCKDEEPHNTIRRYGVFT